MFKEAVFQYVQESGVVNLTDIAINGKTTRSGIMDNLDQYYLQNEQGFHLFSSYILVYLPKPPELHLCEKYTVKIQDSLHSEGLCIQAGVCIQDGGGSVAREVE